MRETKEVLEDHLKLSKEKSIKEDLEKNYSVDVKFLTTYGIYEGYQGATELFELLEKELPQSQFDYKNFLVEGEMGFLEWSGYSEKRKVEDGADSYLVRNGRIVLQTIHYTVIPV